MRRIIILSASFLALIPASALAQFSVEPLNLNTDQFNLESPSVDQFSVAGINNISIAAQPETPRPRQTVNLTVSDYSTGLYGSTITWYVDGEIIESAQNRREASFTAGEIGTTHEVRVVLSAPNASSRTLEKNIRTVYADIVLEPQTRTPEFYKGRALPSIGSTVNATALINGVINDTGQPYIYNWQINQTSIGSGPMSGAATVSFDMPQGSDGILRLEVTDANRNLIARRAISVPSFTPEVIFYEKSELFALSPGAHVRSLILSGNGASIMAEPYNLDVRVYNQPDIIEWKIDNQEVNLGSNPYELTIQRQFGSGSSRINFNIRSTTQFLQGDSGNLTVRY